MPQVKPRLTCDYSSFDRTDLSSFDRTTTALICHYSPSTPPLPFLTQFLTQSKVEIGPDSSLFAEGQRVLLALQFKAVGQSRPLEPNILVMPLGWAVARG